MSARRKMRRQSDKRRGRQSSPVRRRSGGPVESGSPARIEMDQSELESILERAKTTPMSEEEYGKLRAAIETLVFLTQELEKKRVSVQRLKQLLDAPGIKSVDDHWQYQRDTLNTMAAAIAPVMAKALTQHADTRKMGQILAEWDHHDDPDMAAPTIFQAVYRQFALLVFEDELGDELAATMLSDWYFWQERLGKMVADGRSPWFDDVKTPRVKETRDVLFHQAALMAAADLKDRMGSDPATWRWGRVHRIEFVSPIRRQGFGKSLVGGGSHPALGSCETLGRGIYAFNKPFDVVVFASLRMVADLADTDKVLAVLPGGVSGRIFNSHTTDQIKAFINGDKLYWWFSDSAIQQHARHTLVLEP